MFKKIAFLFCALSHSLNYSHIMHTVVLNHPTTSTEVILFGDHHADTQHTQDQTKIILSKLAMLTNSHEYKNGLVKVLFEGLAVYRNYKLHKKEFNETINHLFLDMYKKNKHEHLGFIDIDNRLFNPLLQHITLLLMNISKKKALDNATYTHIKDLLQQLKQELELYFETLTASKAEYSPYMRNLLDIKLSTIKSALSKIDSVPLEADVEPNENSLGQYFSFIAQLANEAAMGIDFNAMQKIADYSCVKKFIIFAGINHTLNMLNALLDQGYKVIYDSSDINSNLKRAIDIRKKFLDNWDLLAQDQESLAKLMEVE